MTKHTKSAVARKLEWLEIGGSAQYLRADNFVSNAGSGGSTFASDDISSVQFPRIKLIHGIDGTNDGDVATANPFPVRVLPVASDGCSVFRNVSLGTTAQSVKASAGTVYGIIFSNTATSSRFLKFYNLASGSTTVGTSTPYLTIVLPGNSADDVSGVYSIPQGIAFSTAITVAATTGITDGDTGAPSTNDVVVNILFK